MMDTRTVLLVVLGVLGLMALITTSLAMDPSKDSRRLARSKEASSEPVGAVFVVLSPARVDHYHHHEYHMVHTERREVALTVEGMAPAEWSLPPRVIATTVDAEPVSYLIRGSNG
jgi:hypothetical protein